MMHDGIPLLCWHSWGQHLTWLTGNRAVLIPKLVTRLWEGCKYEFRAVPSTCAVELRHHACT
jgi:hypothetical protein